MGKPINILVVEDSEEDTLLLLRELKRNGYSTKHQRVETAADLRAALEHHNWDVVVSDYGMPKFSGADALAIYKEYRRDSPFIFVSGTLGEEAAVRMLKAGAADYIIKGNWTRLVPALEREMELVRCRLAKNNCEAAMSHLAAVVHSSQDAVYSQDANCLITTWNPAAEQIYGYQAEEIIGSSVAMLFPGNRRDELLENLTLTRLGQLAAIYDTQRRHKDGTIIPISTAISPIKDFNGEVIGTCSVDRDISYQQREQKLHLRLITELTEALRNSKTIEGDLQICAACKCINQAGGSWVQMESFLAGRAEVSISHDICPDCAEKYAAKMNRDSNDY